MASEPGRADAREHAASIVRTLIAIMLLGQAMRAREDTDVLFDACAALLGNGRSLRISRALVSAMTGDAGPSRELLNDGVEEWPDAAPAMLSIAMALKISGAPEWASVVDRALASARDDGAANARMDSETVNTPTGAAHLHRPTGESPPC